MLAEAYIKNGQMLVVNFPKDKFKGKHWKVDIEPVEELEDKDVIGVFDQFVGVLDNNFSTNDIRYNEIVK